MQNYKLLVWLNGEMTNQVRKDGITAPEVILMQGIHGIDAILEIQKTTMDKRSHKDERVRLIDKYGEKRVGDAFGPSHQRLPVNLDGFAVKEADTQAA